MIQKVSAKERSRILAGEGGPLIPAILADEMWGAARTKAVDLWQQGFDTHRAGFGEYFLDGVAETVDFSSGWSKVGLIAVPVLLLGAAFFAPEVGAVAFLGLSLVTAAVGGIGFLWQGGRAVYNLISGDASTAKEATRSLGHATGTLAAGVSGLFLGAWGATKLGFPLEGGRGLTGLLRHLPDFS